MLSITINDFITIRLCTTTLCVSMIVTVEQFVEVCSSNRASDAACGIYTYPLNVQVQGCQRAFVPVHTSARTQRHTAVSHRHGQSLPVSVLIKTLKLLAPSSTNPLALCSLVREPNGLIQRLSSPLPLSLSFLLCEREHL